MENLNLPPFLPGDKVVFIGEIKEQEMLFPKKHTEVVTIEGPSAVYKGNYYIAEYPFGKTGKRQSFEWFELRKVSESKFRAVSFEKIMEETEKICVS